MSKYDTTLKLLFHRSGRVLMRLLTGIRVQRWVNVETPKTENLRPDLVGADASGEPVHVELQTTNDTHIASRMLRYSLAIYLNLGKVPRQFVLYAGREPLRMRAEFRTKWTTHRFELIDLHALDGDALLRHTDLDVNILALLGQLGDRMEAIRRVLEKMAALPKRKRADALEALLVLSNLRKLERVVEAEAKKMPSLEEILENDVLGREYKKGHEKGHEEGHAKGRQEGHVKGREEVRQQMLRMTRHLLEIRFGPLPKWAVSRLQACTTDDLEALGSRILTAANLRELLTS